MFCCVPRFNVETIFLLFICLLFLYTSCLWHIDFNLLGIHDFKQFFPSGLIHMNFILPSHELGEVQKFAAYIWYTGEIFQQLRKFLTTIYLLLSFSRLQILSTSYAAIVPSWIFLYFYNLRNIFLNNPKTLFTCVLILLYQWSRNTKHFKIEWSKKKREGNYLFNCVTFLLLSTAHVNPVWHDVEISEG